MLTSFGGEGGQFSICSCYSLFAIYRLSLSSYRLSESVRCCDWRLSVMSSESRLGALISESAKEV